MSNHHSVNSSEEIRALLEYMVKHNISHTEELSGIAQQLKVQGNADAFGLIQRALEEYGKGNSLLADALKTIDGRE